MMSALAQLESFADSAIEHANQSHGIVLRHGDFATADRILAEIHHASQTDGELRESLPMLATCYGAWLGQWATLELQAQWVGLHEAQPPRILVGGFHCSPIDGLHRFFYGGASPTSLTSMSQSMHRWFHEARAATLSQTTNQHAWDQLANDPRFAGEIAMPPDRESAIAAIHPWLADDWQVGCRLLCLGGGGGRQGPLHAVAGANVTVVDISREQLEHDRIVADRHGLSLQLLQASADNLKGLDDASFDVVLQPVSACYLPDVRKLYQDVARVLRPGGTYVVQHKQSTSLRVSITGSGTFELTQPSRAGFPLDSAWEGGRCLNANRENGTIEFAHSLQQLLGELCDSSFSIVRFDEPPRADAFAPIDSPEYQACYAPPYFQLKAIKV
jgi:SAM-dependent methyltransferase